jgi:hypothetical protein
MSRTPEVGDILRCTITSGGLIVNGRLYRIQKIENNRFFPVDLITGKPAWEHGWNTRTSIAPNGKYFKYLS